jgi:hypothetical protein
MSDDQKIKKWLDNNCHLGKLTSYSIQSFNPEIGFYIRLGDIDVPHDVFQEEYVELVKIYNKILNKLSNHYDNLKKEE